MNDKPNIAVQPSSETTQIPYERQTHQIAIERERYFDLYNLAPVGYCTLSVDGLILETNLTTASLLGVNHNKLVNEPIARFIPNAFQERYNWHCTKLFASGETQEYELQLVKPGESPFWAHLTAMLPHTQGVSTCYHLVISDITTYKRVEEEHLYLERKLQQARKEECLGRMAKAVAHHYNNLMMTVLGNLELALDATAIPEEAAKLMDNARAAANRAADISRLMLAYLGQSANTKKNLYLAETCRPTLDAVALRLPENARLDLVLASPDLAIKADAAQIRQMLEALLINATEALGETGGTITVTIEKKSTVTLPHGYIAPSDWIPVDACYAKLTVADTGNGMTTETLERLFDPFFSSKFMGRGLGASVALGIVKAHGGVIFVDSKPGAGTSVCVLLPLSNTLPQESPAVPVAQSDPNSKNGEWVLVVDDEPAILNLTQATLRKIGFESITATNGAEAIEIFGQHPQKFCCVLCDLTMPGMNGWQTLSGLRHLRSDIPVILCSGHDEASVMADTCADRPQAFLGKPYAREALSEALAKACIQTPA